MNSEKSSPMLSFMLCVSDTPGAVEWYKKALGAKVLWSLGSVAGLEINGAPFFLHEGVKKKFETPEAIGTTTVRIELFADKPDEIIDRALKAGAAGNLSDIRDYQVSWGIHRQGGFTDPFGHVWLVGDKSPLKNYSEK